jgi:GNAT superfamily N-acetyltransferase
VPAGSLVLESLRTTDVLGRLEVVSRRSVAVRSTSAEPRTWTIVGFELGTAEPDAVAADLQASLRPGPWYVDFQHSGRVYVVFASNRFDYEFGDETTHNLAVVHAKSIGIPDQQIDWSWRPPDLDRIARHDVVFDIADPQSDATIAAMTAYFDELDQRFPTGFDLGDTLVADAPKFRRPRGVFLTGAIHSEVVACGGVTKLDDGVGEIKRMWVAPDLRGLGLGRRMLSELEDQCRTLGHHTVRTDTNSVLTEAITMYERAGYHSIERYNDNPFAKHWFEKSLVDRQRV